MTGVLDYKLPFTFIVLLFSVYCLHSQKIKASSYGFDSDPTSAFVLALKSEFDTIIIDKQSKDWVMKPMVLANIKNKVILIEQGVEIRAKSGAFLKTTDALFNFTNCEDIEFYGNGNKICMNKSEYTDGEWRHGISLRKCNNFLIKNVKIYDTGGDGIYISGTYKGTFSENIHIENVTCVNNKRQGMSIISAKDVVVKNSIFRDTYGTLPGAGLDIEPNSKLDRIENIKFYDCIFKNNDHAGIALALHNLEADSKPVNIGFFNCVIENNHNENNRYIASELIFNSHKTNPVKGKVVFENCLVKNSEWGLFHSRKTVDAYSVIFKNCAALDICKDGTFPPIYLEVPDYYTGSYQLGGYIFENMTLGYESNVPYLLVRGSTFPTLKRVSTISGEITIISNQKAKVEYIKYDPLNNVNVNLKVRKGNGHKSKI